MHNVQQTVKNTYFVAHVRNIMPKMKTLMRFQGFSL